MGSSGLRQQLQRTLGDQCTLERELGGGGMSRAFVAQETAPGRSSGECPRVSRTPIAFVKGGRSWN